MYSNIKQQSSTMQNYSYFCTNLILIKFCQSYGKKDLSFTAEENAKWYHHTGRFLVSNKAKHNINIRSSSSCSFKNLHNFHKLHPQNLAYKVMATFFIITKKLEATKWSFDRYKFKQTGVYLYNQNYSMIKKS